MNVILSIVGQLLSRVSQSHFEGTTFECHCGIRDLIPLTPPLEYTNVRLYGHDGIVTIDGVRSSETRLHIDLTYPTVTDWDFRRIEHGGRC